MQTLGQIIGQRMAQIREARGWSQDLVAKLLEVSPTAYAKIERGETDVQISRLQSIAKSLQVEVRSVCIFFSRKSRKHDHHRRCERKFYR